MTTHALDEDVERLVEALQVLASDVEQAAHLSQHEDTQFARRAYVRSAFALVEGNLNLMADVILLAEQRQEIVLRPSDFEILRQERRVSDSKGITVVRVKFVPVRDRMAPIFELFSHLYGKYFQLDRSTGGWTHFLRAIELRNRITHPKNATSFTISDDDLATVEKARGWFADRVENLLNEC